MYKIPGSTSFTCIERSVQRLVVIVAADEKLLS